MAAGKQEVWSLLRCKRVVRARAVVFTPADPSPSPGPPLHPSLLQAALPWARRPLLEVGSEPGLEVRMEAGGDWLSAFVDMVHGDDQYTIAVLVDLAMEEGEEGLEEEGEEREREEAAAGQQAEVGAAVARAAAAAAADGIAEGTAEPGGSASAADCAAEGGGGEQEAAHEAAQVHEPVQEQEQKPCVAADEADELDSAVAEGLAAVAEARARGDMPQLRVRILSDSAFEVLDSDGGSSDSSGSTMTGAWRLPATSLAEIFERQLLRQAERRPEVLLRQQQQQQGARVLPSAAEVAAAASWMLEEAVRRAIAMAAEAGSREVTEEMATVAMAEVASEAGLPPLSKKARQAPPSP